MNTRDYTLLPEAYDWPTLLSNWGWLLANTVTPMIVNRLGDLVIVNKDKTVSFFDIGCGRLNQIAKSREEFLRLLEQGNNATEWLAIPFVNKLVKRNLKVTEDAETVYGFKTPPLLGGEYNLDNIEVTDIYSYYSFLGDLFSEMEDLRNTFQVTTRFSK